MAKQSKYVPGDRVRVKAGGSTHSLLIDHKSSDGYFVGFVRGVRPVKFTDADVIKVENRIGVRQVVRAF